MRTNALALSLVLSLVGAASIAANDDSLLVPQSPGFSYRSARAHIGTWKLNEAKSTFDTGATKNTTVVYFSSGDSVKVTVDGIDANGKRIHTAWIGKFDGTPYLVKGGGGFPTEYLQELVADTRTYTVTDDHTLTFVEKRGATETNSGRAVVSADGKTRTVDATATDSKGMKVSTHAVYDKQ